MESNYYIARKRKLLREFDKTLERIRGLFVARYGEEATTPMLREAQEEYEALITQLPYIGGKQPFTQFLISTAWFLAMYRVLTRRRETVEDIGLLAYQASELYLKTYPAFLRRVLGQMTFSRRYLRRLQKRAAESWERCYPGDYVYNYIRGDGKTFDYGVDYVECAGLKFLRAQGASELAPYICPADILYSDALGWGLQRTMTLAEGGERCDFRFKQGGETRVAVPKPLEAFLQSRSPAPIPAHRD